MTTIEKFETLFRDAKDDFSQNTSWIIPVVAFLMALTLVVVFICQARAEGLTTSYYTVESCLKESGQYTMANGRLLDDSKKTCASWDYKFGTVLLITNTRNGKSVEVTVTDRGPNKYLYRQGRVLDLSLAAFSAIADTEQGIITVTVRVIK